MISITCSGHSRVTGSLVRRRRVTTKLQSCGKIGNVTSSYRWNNWNDVELECQWRSLTVAAIIIELWDLCLCSNNCVVSVPHNFTPFQRYFHSRDYIVFNNPSLPFRHLKLEATYLEFASKSILSNVCYILLNIIQHITFLKCSKLLKGLSYWFDWSLIMTLIILIDHMPLPINIPLCTISVILPVIIINITEIS